MAKKRKINPKIKKIVQRCKNDPVFFINNFCNIQHPAAGIIPFKLFGYQQKCIENFLEHRMNIFRKCRQSGISTLCGAFSLWFTMFHSNKNVLIVSKTERDATNFLRQNVKFIYLRLPKWMRDLWPLQQSGEKLDNAHTVGFPNGSRITSLNSGQDVLRSHASSLNIIDEAAFMPHMDEMWKSGFPTLMHGGKVIVVSTVNGIGNWYWSTWTDAESNYNDFNAIRIDWWNMDWKIDYKNSMTGQMESICPTAGIRETTTREEKERFGPYWSPWLESEYRNLTKKGDSSGFRQEVLADFLGSGNTVLTQRALRRIEAEIKKEGKKYKTVRYVDYVNPFTQAKEQLDFQDRFWVWEEPQENHLYGVGADVSTGESTDFHSIQVIDIGERKQVAEIELKTTPGIFSKMCDYVARWYNYALLNVERTGIGQAVCSELNTELLYPNLYRDKLPAEIGARNRSKKILGKVGFATTGSSKPVLDRNLIDFLEDEDTDDGGCDFNCRSHRLSKQLAMYIYTPSGKTGNEPGIGNNDDLVIALELAMLGSRQVNQRDMTGLAPFQMNEAAKLHDPEFAKEDTAPALIKKAAEHNLLLPYSEDVEQGMGKDYNPSKAIAKFTAQLGGITKEQRKVPKIVKRKHGFNK